MLVLDVAVGNVALAAIQTDLRVPSSLLAWVTTSYALAFGGLLILAGRSGDLYGRRRLFLIGLALFTLASVACGAAQEAWQLIAARAVQGVGAAIASPAALSLLLMTHPEGAARNRALATWGAVASAGAVAGTLLGGLMVDALSWRAVFLVNLPIGVLAIIAAWQILPPDPPRTAGRLDLPGGLLLTGGLVLVVLAASRVGLSTLSTVLGTATAGCVLLIAFVAVERRSREPLIDFSLFRNRIVLAGNLIAACGVAAASGALFFVGSAGRDAACRL